MAPDEERLLEIALEGGAEDLRDSETSWDIVTAPQDFKAVQAALESAGVPVFSAELSMVPQSTIPVAGRRPTQVLQSDRGARGPRRRPERLRELRHPRRGHGHPLRALAGRCPGPAPPLDCGEQMFDSTVLGVDPGSPAAASPSSGTDDRHRGPGLGRRRPDPRRRWRRPRGCVGSAEAVRAAIAEHRPDGRRRRARGVEPQPGERAAGRPRDRRGDARAPPRPVSRSRSTVRTR